MKQVKYWRFIEHAKEPITKDEIEISNILEKMVGANMYKNFEYLNSLILEDAIFINQKGEIKDKLGFFEWRRKRGVPRVLKYKNVVIDVRNSELAVVILDRYRMSGSFKESLIGRYFEFVKNGNSWKLSKSAFKESHY